MEKNEKTQILHHTYDAIANVVFNKEFKDLSATEKDVVKQMCD